MPVETKTTQSMRTRRSVWHCLKGGPSGPVRKRSPPANDPAAQSRQEARPNVAETATAGRTIFSSPTRGRGSRAWESCGVARRRSERFDGTHGVAIVGTRLRLLRLPLLTTNLVDVEILASARRHGISDDDIRHAVENSLAGGRSDDETGFAMLVGPDQSGNLIEVGIVVTDDIEYAIHAMRARNPYLDWL